jgi:ABC-type transport system involved in multi-copper enzyme maturation permease subunit
MSAATVSTSVRVGGPAGSPVHRPSFATLTRVELRKTVDTRAGRVLLGLTLALSTFVLGYLVARGEAGGLSYGGWVRDAIFPVVLLLPVLGVMAMASEWTQRTVLTTFTATPRRARVLAAKLVASVLLGMAAVVVVDMLAAVALATRAAILGHAASWTGLGSAVGGSMVSAGLALLMGAALGALLMQTAVAIVAYFVAPNVVLLAVASLASDKVEWVDVNLAFQRLSSFDLSGHVGQTLTPLVLWIGLPLVLGILRSLRRNVS